MGQRKSRRVNTKEQVIAIVTEILSSALDNDDDLILTYETYPDSDKRDLHVLTGKLIFPCMLGTLKNKAVIHEKEGSRRVTMRW